MVGAGVPVTLSSDCPVEKLDAFAALASALGGESWRPGETLSAEEAIRAYCLGSAYAAHLDDRLGSIEEGKLADFVVLSEDPTKLDASGIARLRAQAPNAELRIRPSNMGVTEALLAGRIDLAIGSFRRVPEPFVCEPLFQETRVWVLSADHPAAGAELTLERLASLSHLIISATGEDEYAVNGFVSDHGLERLVTRSEVGLLESALAARGLRRLVGLTTPHFPAALAVVSQSDMAAPLPRRLAAAFAERYRLKLFEPPYTSPPFDIMALWHRDHGEDRAVAWLRGVLREVAAGL